MSADLKSLELTVNALAVQTVALKEEIAALKAAALKPLDKRISDLVGPWTKWEQSVDFTKKTTTAKGSFKVGGSMDGTATITVDKSMNVDVTSTEFTLKGFEFAGVPSELVTSPWKDKATLKGKIKPMTGVELDLTQPLRPAPASPGVVLKIKTKGDNGGESETKVDLVKYTADLKLKQEMSVGAATVKYSTAKDVWSAEWQLESLGGELTVAASTDNNGELGFEYTTKVSDADVTLSTDAKFKDVSVGFKYDDLFCAEGGFTLTNAGLEKPTLEIKKEWML
mmetsp:Transcript_5140/g.17940  ORF Transcript_5140/g.17940 Transcript_5140/m.17940 type:complete len:282 (+) Transcript_5140:91-936(+)